MITDNRKTLFGGRVTTIYTDSFFVTLMTAKEGFFDGLSTVICQGMGLKAIPCGKLIYAQSTSKADRQSFHYEAIDKLDEMGENGDTLYSAINAVIASFEEREIISNGINLYEENKVTFINKPKSILFGNHEKSVTEVITSYIQDSIGDNISIVIESEAVMIKEKAEGNHIDLFVLVLNNILYPYNLPAENRFGQMLDLISELKQRYNKPVIALAGWLPNPELTSKITEAGADYFFKMPFRPKQFQEAVISCLPNQNE